MPKFEDRYPDGKMNSADEGVVNIKVASDGKRIIVDFGMPVIWLAMTKEEAFEFARTIMRHAVDKVITLDIPDAP